MYSIHVESELNKILAQMEREAAAGRYNLPSIFEQRVRLGLLRDSRWPECETGKKQEAK
jgi:hypothetical protein